MKTLSQWATFQYIKYIGIGFGFLFIAIVMLVMFIGIFGFPGMENYL
jgi:hypothetical protein